MNYFEDMLYDDYAKKGYVEAVEITYDPSKVSYQDLLDVYWKQIDPTDATGQFIDRGSQYRTIQSAIQKNGSQTQLI